MENKIICQICTMEFKSIQSLISHITNKKHHNLPIKEYYDKYIKNDNEEYCLNEKCPNKTKFHSFSKGYRDFCSCKCSANTIKRIYVRSEEQNKKHAERMKKIWSSKHNPYNSEKIKNTKSLKMKQHWLNKDSKLNSVERSKKISKIQTEVWNNDDYKEKRSQQMIDLRRDKNSIYNSEEYIKNHLLSYDDKVKLKMSKRVKDAWKDPNNKLGDDSWKQKRIEYMKNIGASHCNRFISNPSKPQVELFKLLQTIFPYPIMNYPSNGYSIDIAIPILNLAIEYDGSYWHKNKEYDNYRQKCLEDDGWIFLRFIDYIPSKEELMEGYKNEQKKAE